MIEFESHCNSNKSLESILNIIGHYKTIMEEDQNQLKEISFFDPELAELATFRQRSEIYQTHLRKLRKMMWIALSIFFVICWQFSQNGRYQTFPNAEGHALIIDTRNGSAFDLAGIGNDNKSKPVKIYRIEMGFWPYFGFWKVKTQH